MASDAGHHCIPVSVRLLQAVCISLGMSYADMELYNVRDSQVKGDPVPLKMLNLCGTYLHISASVLKYLFNIGASPSVDVRCTLPVSTFVAPVSARLSSGCNRVAIMKRPEESEDMGLDMSQALKC